MLALLMHWYRFAELYAVVLVWIVVPLFFYECYYFFSHHYEIFNPQKRIKEGNTHAST